MSGRVTPVTVVLSDRRRLFMTHQEVADELVCSRRELDALLECTSDPAVAVLLRHRARRGRGGGWKYLTRAVLMAAEDLGKREWPVQRTRPRIGRKGAP